MTKFVHIVHIHPLELGEPNLYKVKHEEEFIRLKDAERYLWRYNSNPEHAGQTRAVYQGRVNAETGELACVSVQNLN
jgi:acyl-CoA thioesterase